MRPCLGDDLFSAIRLSGDAEVRKASFKGVICVLTNAGDVLDPSASDKSSTPSVCFKSSFRILDLSLAAFNRSPLALDILY